MKVLYDVYYSVSTEEPTKVGVVYYENGKYKAVRLRDDYNPRLFLYGFKPIDEVDDTAVRHFIKNRVIPSTRDGIADILKLLGMTHYDEFELFDKTYGREFNDDFVFVHPGEPIPVARPYDDKVRDYLPMWVNGKLID